MLGVEPATITFCSGGTEADNLAIFGAQAAHGRGAVVSSAVEHPAVLEPVAALGGRTVAVDHRGVIDLDHLAHVLDESGEVAAVSVMAAGRTRSPETSHRPRGSRNFWNTVEMVSR